MRLTDAQVVIRPRNPWEAIDVGILLAHRHMGLLAGSWLAITLPAYIVLSLIFWEHPVWASIAFWWLKPAFDRLPLDILSRALFNETPTFKQALRHYPTLLKKELAASLLWRRFSPTRSFDLPISQLEGLHGKKRTQRLMLLRNQNAGYATWLTFLGILIEISLMIGLFILLHRFSPAHIAPDASWQTVFSPLIGSEHLDQHLSNLIYVFVLTLWEPIYIASGFTLYLNRRTQLEAWDIELEFRRLRQRIVGSAYAVLLAITSAFFMFQTPSSMAATDESPKVIVVQELPVEQSRLLKQKLNSEQAQKSIRGILDEPPFVTREERRRWTRPANEQEDGSHWLSFIMQRLEDMTILGYLARFIEIGLWALLITIIVLALWRSRHWLALQAERIGFQRLHTRPPETLFGMDIAPERLPDDLASEAERLYQEQPRQALSLLYRGLLSRLAHDYRVPLNSAHTEGEVLNLAKEQLDQDALKRYAASLTFQWQRLAYGHQLPDRQTCEKLCSDWRHLFDGDRP